MTAAHGDEFAEYAAASIPSLRRLALLLCRNWHDADDLVQAALFKLCRTGTGPPRLTAPMLTFAPSWSGSLSGDGERRGQGG